MSPPAAPAATPTTRGPFRGAAYVLGVTAFGAGIPTPLYARYQTEFGFGAGVLGLVFASYTIGVLATLLLLAPLSDRIGRRPLLLVGMALTAVSGVAFILASGAGSLAVARVISGLAVGATTGTATAAMARLEPNLDQHHVARVSVAANFGGVALGVLLSGLLVQYAPYPTTLVFVVLIAASVAGLLVVARLPETVRVDPTRRPVLSYRIWVPSSLHVVFAISALALAACYSIYGFFGALAPSFVRESLGLTGAAATGAVVATMFGSAALVQLATAQIRDRRALLLGFPLLVLGLSVFTLALFVADLPLVLASAALLGGSVGLAFMGSVTLIDRVAPEARRGEILSAFYLVGYAALAVPTIGLSFASERFGIAPSAAAFGITLALFAFVGWWATARTPTPPGGGGRPRPESTGPAQTVRS